MTRRGEGSVEVSGKRAGKGSKERIGEETIHTHREATKTGRWKWKKRENRREEEGSM